MLHWDNRKNASRENPICFIIGSREQRSWSQLKDFTLRRKSSLLGSLVHMGTPRTVCFWVQTPKPSQSMLWLKESSCCSSSHQALASSTWCWLWDMSHILGSWKHRSCRQIPRRPRVPLRGWRWRRSGEKKTGLVGNVEQRKQLEFIGLWKL